MAPRPKRKQEPNSPNKQSTLESMIVRKIPKIPIKQFIPKQLTPKQKYDLASEKQLWIGAHLSASGGVHKAIERGQNIGAFAIALFLKSQRQWNAKPLEPSVVQDWKDALVNPINANFKEFSDKKVLPHGSYLVNLGNPDQEKLKRAAASFLDDVQRAEKLGISLYNFHPGSAVDGISVDNCIDQIANELLKVLKATNSISLVIECMAGQGNTIGGPFNHLSKIIKKVVGEEPSFKHRIGVCLDTCHMFAAGHDIRTKESFDKVMSEFEENVGVEYLKALHLNDSKGKLGDHLDRHEKIGKGAIGLEAFHYIVNDSRFRNIPLILETPLEEGEDENYYTKEIDLLYGLVE